MSLEQQHCAIYGDLDPFAVAPFMERYGVPLSAEGHRRASLLHRVLGDRQSPIALEIKIEVGGVSRARC